jgi:chorismate mutase/prephenate dehydratase
MADDADRLKELRARIDAIDAQLLRLIAERAECARSVAEVKRSNDSDSGYYRPEREAQVLRRVIEQNPGPLAGEEVARLFREIMSACLALEQPLRIGFLGPEGTFTQTAALKHFGHSVATAPLPAIDTVFREVESGGCHYGVVPVENSTEGVVNHTLDSFMSSPLKVCGEIELRIHHHLLAVGDSLADVKRVYSHQQSLAQCREWLDAHLVEAERITVASNALAAERAAADPEAAAIAGETAAELYDLRLLERNIEDHPDNTTRFLVVGREDVAPSGQDKTSLLVSATNRPGALYRLLRPLSENGISLTRIESRPSHCVNWEYVFFFDIEGHREEAGVAAALQALAGEADLVKVLGSYPKAAL